VSPQTASAPHRKAHNPTNTCSVSSPWRLYQEAAMIELHHRSRSLSTSAVRSRGAWAEQKVSAGEVRKRVANYGTQVKYSAQAIRSQTQLIREADSLPLISCSRLKPYMTYLSFITMSLLTPMRSSYLIGDNNDVVFKLR
jgi:hypothetical protein